MANHFLLKQAAYINGEMLSPGHVFVGEAKDVPSGSVPCNEKGEPLPGAKPVQHRKPINEAPASAKSDAVVSLLAEKIEALEARIETLEHGQSLESGQTKTKK